MARFKRFTNKQTFKEFSVANKLNEYTAIVGSGFASLSLIKNLKSKKIIVFEKGKFFNEKNLCGLEINNLGTFALKENSLEESIGGASNTWSGRLSEMNKEEFGTDNPDGLEIFNNLSSTFYKKAWEFFDFKNFKQIERQKNKFTERILPKQYKPLRVKKALVVQDVEIVYESNVLSVGEDINGTFLDVNFSDSFKEKIYFKRIILANGGIKSSLILKKSYERGFISPNKSDLILKKYMNHPKITLKNFFLFIPTNSNFFLKKRYDLNFYGYSLSNKLKKIHKLGNTYFTFHPVAHGENSLEYKCADEILRNKRKFFKVLLNSITKNNFSFSSIMKVFYYLGCRLKILNIKIKNYHLEYFCEMAPNETNKIYDNEGFITSEIKLSEDDLKNLEFLHKLLIDEFPTNIRNKYKNINFRTKKFSDASHHLGGLPMNLDVKKSVIDKNLKIIESKNVYVCSSSVLQNSGSSNPTLTIVALGIRLAEHLNSLEN